jgi:urease accessory protein
MRHAPENQPPAAAEPFPGELLIWLSPGFPVGGFAYSHGLETAAEASHVTDRESLTDWLLALTDHGALHGDLILLSLVYRAPDAEDVRALAELAAALQPSSERAQEALVQGQNFRAAYLAGWSPDKPTAFDWLGERQPTFAVAVGLAARDRGLPLAATLEAYAIAFHNNLISAAIRLGVVGQFDGQRILSALLPAIRRAAHFAEDASEDDLGSAAFAADLASMKHETQKVRLFRS